LTAALNARPVAIRRPAERLINPLLFLAIAVSSIVIIEPAPYEGVLAFLGLACIAGGVTFDRKLVPLIALLALWNLGGLLSLTQVSHDRPAITFVTVSVYLGASAILLAALYTHDTMRRIEITRTAYVIAALLATTYGVFIYASGADVAQFAGRVRGTFKDPNVYGPFLILPLLMLGADLFQRGFNLWKVLAAGILLLGLLMSFSRGAWLNFGISAAVTGGMMFLTAPSPRVRFRLVAMGLIAAIMLSGLVAAALSVGTVGKMFEERAKVTQYYDTGDRGRFTTQREALDIVLEHPNGVGPYQLRHHTGVDPHQVYINAFASYGWIGGAAYLALVLSTLLLGFRYALVRAPWGPYLIAAFATFFGTAIEGLVIDTDHWRHFFLLLGIIWGLSIATRNALHTQRRVRPA
jgi:hypothetical protein